MGNFLPRKALPNGEADRDSGIEMSARCRGAGYDRKGYPNGESPADRKDTAKSCNPDGRFKIQGEGCYCCNAREADQA